MASHIGDRVVDFEPKTTNEEMRFRAWISDEWAVLFRHPEDLAIWCGASQNSTGEISRFLGFPRMRSRTMRNRRQISVWRRAIR